MIGKTLRHLLKLIGKTIPRKVLWLPVPLSLILVTVLPLTSCQKTHHQNRKEYYEKLYKIPKLPDQIENPAESLNILCWNDYFPEDLFTVFEDIYRTKINVEYFSNNEELREKYQKDPEKWDLMMPSDYMVPQFIREDYLLPTQRNRLPKIEQLMPGMFELDCDPGLNYFIPIYYSSLGLSFEVQHVGGFPRHWDFLDQQIKNPYIYSRIALPDQMRVVFAMALMKLHLDPNSTNPDDIKKAEEFLVSFVREFGAQFVGDEIIDKKILNKFLLVLTWNGTGAYILKVDSNYRFLIPEDKTIFAVDGFVICKDTQNLDSCYLFLDYLMTPRVLASLSNYSYYAPASQMAQRYVDSFILNGPSLLMPSENNRLYLKDVGDAESLYKAAWDRVKRTKPRRDMKIIPIRNN